MSDILLDLLNDVVRDEESHNTNDTANTRAGVSISPEVDKMDLFFNCEQDLIKYINEFWELKRIDVYARHKKAIAHLERHILYRYANIIK